MGWTIVYPYVLNSREVAEAWCRQLERDTRCRLSVEECGDSYHFIETEKAMSDEELTALLERRKVKC